MQLLIGTVDLFFGNHGADKGSYQQCVAGLVLSLGSISVRGKFVIDRVDRRASLALVASSLLYFLVLGGIEGELGTTHIDEVAE